MKSDRQDHLQKRATDGVRAAGRLQKSTYELANEGPAHLREAASAAHRLAVAAGRAAKNLGHLVRQGPKKGEG
jgi:hypothetical protein